MRGGRDGIRIAAAALAALTAAARGASEKDWRDALAAVRRVALDANETEAHRANAVAACAKLLAARGRGDDAREFCRAVARGAGEEAVADAALRAGGLVERARSGHLRAEMEFVRSCASGPAARAAGTLTRELERAVRKLTSLAGRRMPPEPVTCRVPRWATGSRGRGPSALGIEPPRLAAPSWLGRVAFPPLKEPKE
jgi:hypothetical protein